MEHVVTQAEELKKLMLDFQDKEYPGIDEEQKQEQQRKKADMTFKNVSTNLVQLIDNAPPVIDHDAGEQQQFIGSQNMLEQLVFGESQEGCIDNKIFGYLLVWNAMLSKIEQGRIKV